MLCFLFQIKIEGTTAISYYGDIAVDDITVLNQVCPSKKMLQVAIIANVWYIK